MKICPNCNAELKAGAKQCENCGNEIITKRNSHNAKKSGGFKSVLKIAIPVVAVLVVAAVIISIIVSPASTNSEYFGYLRDGEIFISDYSEGYGDQITDNFKENNNMIFGNYREYIRLSNDGKKIFYVDNYDGSSYKLYMKETGDNNSKPVKISSDILVYDISDDGSVVTYIKDSGYLYQHNLKNQSDLIDSKVAKFLTSDNGKTILYQKNSEGDKPYQFDLYLSKSGEKGKKIVSNIDAFKYVSNDLSTVYYTTNSTLYKLNVGKKPVKLLENVLDIIKVYDSGEIFFTKSNDSGKTSLYYFDGNKISGALVDNYYRTESVASEKPVIVVCSDDESISYSVVIKNKSYKIEQSVVSISLNAAGTEIYYTADFDTKTQLTSLYTAKIDNSLKNVKKVATDVFQGKYLSGEKYVYVKDYNTSTMTGTVYVDNKAVGKNVYYSSIKYCKADNQILYFDNKDDSNARLNKFTKGKSSVICDSVFVSSLSVIDSKTVFLADYFTDDGILYVYADGKLVKVDHDVSNVFAIITNEEYDVKSRTIF